MAALRELLVLDTEPEPLFDSLAKLASEVCGTPIALLSLIDDRRQWFKANVGLTEITQGPREEAFCAHTIQGNALFEVPDASLDPRFADNPLVTGEPEIRFYAGAPLVLPGGERVGSLCVIDRQARRLDAAQAQTLRALADVAIKALVMRRDLISKALAARSRYETALAASEATHRAIVDMQSEMISLARADGTLVYVNPAYARQFGREAAQMRGANLFDFIAPADREIVRSQLERVLASEQSQSSENRMLAPDGGERWVAWTNGVQRDAEGRPLLHSVGRDISERKRVEQALRASQAFLARTGRVAGVGGWELDLLTSKVTWSAQTRLIHEVPADFEPSLDTAVNFYTPTSRPVIEEAVRVGMEHGQPWDLELSLITATGRPIEVRAQGEVEFEDGRPVRLVGAFHDITERKRLEQRVTDSERFLRQIADSLPIRIAYVDAQLRYSFVNLAHSKRFGRAREEIIGRTREELAPRDLDFGIDARVSAVLAGQPQRFEFEESVNGELRQIDSHLIPDVAEDGRVRGFFSTGVDITERAAAQRFLQLQTATLRSVTESIPAIVVVVDSNLRYRFVNGAFERWYGVSREQVVGRLGEEVLPASDSARSRPWALRALAGETVQFERDYPAREGAPHLAVTYVPLRLDDGRVDGFVGVAQDVTQQHKEQARLQDLAQRDPLTGLLNRGGFNAQLERHLQDGNGPSLALLYIDLDRFKPVNDQHGHAVGDQVLRHFAQRLTRLVRPSDAVARLGGDEFAVLLQVREAPNAHAVANKVIAAASAPFNLHGLQVRIGASVGVAVGADAARGADELLARADAQLYLAKAAGRGQSA